MKGGTEGGGESINGIFLLLQNISLRIDIVKMQRGNNKRCIGDKGEKKIILPLLTQNRADLVKFYKCFGETCCLNILPTGQRH